jgi:hypothetical protein
MIHKLQGKPENDWPQIITAATTKRNESIARRIQKVAGAPSLEEIEKMPLLCVTDLVYHVPHDRSAAQAGTHTLAG